MVIKQEDSIKAWIKVPLSTTNKISAFSWR
jgi:hypothetical protein